MLDWVGRHNTGVIRTPLPPNFEKALVFARAFFLLKVLPLIKFWIDSSLKTTK